MKKGHDSGLPSKINGYDPSFPRVPILPQRTCAVGSVGLFPLSRVHFLRDMVRDGSVKLIKFASTQNVADALTKSLPRPAFHKHREFLKGTAQSFSAFFAGLRHKKGQPFLLQSPSKVYRWIMFISIPKWGTLGRAQDRRSPARPNDVLGKKPFGF